MYNLEKLLKTRLKNLVKSERTVDSKFESIFLAIIDGIIVEYSDSINMIR